jgi:hypothetical protein
MNTVCPDCGVPVAVKPQAREGRCDECRPQRRHSEKRMDTASQFQQYVHQHRQRTQRPRAGVNVTRSFRRCEDQENGSQGRERRPRRADRPAPGAIPSHIHNRGDPT